MKRIALFALILGLAGCSAAPPPAKPMTTAELKQELARLQADENLDPAAKSFAVTGIQEEIEKREAADELDAQRAAR